MSMLVSFVLSFFPRDVLDAILNLIGSVSEGFPSYSYLWYIDDLKKTGSIVINFFSRTDLTFSCHLECLVRLCNK